MVLTIPVGMHHEAEVALRELPIAILKEFSCVRRDAVAGHWHVLKHSLANHGALAVESRDGHL